MSGSPLALLSESRCGGFLNASSRKAAQEIDRGDGWRWWPELEKVLKDHGVSNYSIFLHPETRQLFGYAEIESEEQWASIASTEICQKWWKQNVEIMPSNSDYSPVSAPLREVFHLE